MSQKYFNCPCCGWDKIDTRPYKNMPDNPHPVTLKPPYTHYWGAGSYDVCECCGFEYGLDDDPGIDSQAYSFHEYLRKWFVEEKASWSYSKTKPPENWDLVRQLEKAGIEVPEYIRVSRQLGSGKK